MILYHYEAAQILKEQEMTNSDPDWLPCGHNLMWKQKLADEQVE